MAPSSRSKNVALEEWAGRGYQNRMQIMSVHGRITYPAWFGRHDFHAAHRSNLLRKDRSYYSRFGWNEPPDLPYKWG